MNDLGCERLDDYLDRGMSDPERAAFAAHLAGCSLCREVAHRHEQMERLLARAVTELELVPALLTERIQHRLRAARQRRWLRYGAALTAAAVLAAVGVAGWLLTRPPEDPPGPPPVVVVQPDPPEP